MGLGKVTGMLAITLVKRSLRAWVLGAVVLGLKEGVLPQGAKQTWVVRCASRAQTPLKSQGPATQVRSLDYSDSVTC